MKIHELLSDPSKFTQRTFARDINDADVPVDSSDAVCWCAHGAMQKCYGDNYFPMDKNIIDPAAWKYCREHNIKVPEGRNAMVFINDHVGYEAVYSIFKQLDL